MAKRKNNDLLVIGTLLAITYLWDQVGKSSGGGIFGGGGFGGGFIPGLLEGDQGGTGSLVANDEDPTTDEDIGVAPATESTTALNPGTAVSPAAAQKVAVAVAQVPKTQVTQSPRTLPSAPVISDTSAVRFVGTGKIPVLGPGESATIPSAVAAARVDELRRQAGDDSRRSASKVTASFISTGKVPTLGPGESTTIPSIVAAARVEELRNQVRLRRTGGNEGSPGRSRSTSDLDPPDRSPPGMI